MFFKQINQHQNIGHEGGLEAGYRYLPSERYSEGYAIQSKSYAQENGYVPNEPAGQNDQFEPESASFQAIVFNEHLESSI